MSDKQKIDLVTSALGFYDKAIQPAQMPFWLTVLQPYDLAQIKQAITDHLANPDAGRFAPKPADIVREIEKRSPRGITPDEAWSMALLGRDESATVMTNTLIDAGMAAANPILQLGDKVGARMAFLAAYKRADGHVPCVWRVSLGHDITQREYVIRDAVVAGYITAASVQHLLPAPITQAGANIAGLLTGKVVEPDARWRELSNIVKQGIAKKEDERQAKRDAAEAKRQEVLMVLGGAA